MTTHDQHPHEAWQQAVFGCAHISQHRTLPQHVAALRQVLADLVRGIPREEQIARLRTLNDTFHHDLHQTNRPFDPVHEMIRGARAYNQRQGFGDPHQAPYHQVRTTADTIDRIGPAYDRLPERDNDSLHHFHAMGEEVGRQFDHLTGPRSKGGLGIHVESVDHDPYPTVHHMVHDLRENHRMQVLGTHVTGGHPFFSNDQNDQFRAVHDAFGHAATGRGFDANGEEAAYLAHSRMFSHHALPAMISETRGQNGFVHLNGDFGSQKIAVLPEHIRNLPVIGARPHQLATAKAADWDEYRRINDAQDRRYERAGIVGGQEEHDQFYGRGEHSGAGMEHRLTPQEWMRHSHEPTFDELPPHEHEWHRGYDLGAQHSTGIDEDAFDRAYAGSTHPDHFFSGYTEGLRVVAAQHPLADPQAVADYESGQQRVREIRGTPLCDWHTERAKELMGLSDQIARQTGLTDEDVPHEFQEGPTYPGRCVACERAQQANGGHPWEAPQGGGSRPSIQSDRMPYARSWPNRPRRTEPFMPLPQSMSSRVAVRRGQTPLAPGEIGLQRIAHQISADMPDVVVIKKLAHDSGDGQTIFHCFGGETRYITRDGVKTLAETVGTTQWVLTGTVDDPHGGFWLQAPVVELGEQELWEVILKRNRRKKVIRATAGHRWLVRQPDRVVTTENLKPDHRLAHLRARQFDLVPSNDGIRMGLVYGDGSIQYRDATTYGCVTLWGEKRQLGKYFDEIAVQSHETVTPNGVRGLRYTSGMKGYTKNLPGVHETPEFLLGWLMGYFAADGAVSAIGQVALSSASLEALERVRDICTTLGIGTYEPVMRMRPGYGVTPTALHTVNFMAEDLPSEFFLRDDHRNRVKVDGKPARIGWTVESVRPTGKVETVYCVRAHGTDTFTLEDNIHTGQCPFCGSGQVIATSDGGVSCEFCKASFSVQIQPQYPAFPQTIDGQPVNVPDMGPDFTPYGGTPPGEEAPMPMDGDEEDPNGGDPMGANADETEPPEEDDDESGDEGGGGNPFAKKSFVTTTGAVLSRDAYLRHLALACSPDRDVTLARLRAINGTR